MAHLPEEHAVVHGKKLPRHYGKDYLVLLSRDPYWIFAYWELTPGLKSNLSSEPVLRAYRQIGEGSEGNEGWETFDIKLGPFSDCWHIHVGVPDRNYYVELGCYRENNIFIPVLQSNTVSTPRDSLSDIIDEEWRLPDFLSRRFYRRLSRNNLSSLELVRLESALQERRHVQ